MAMQLLCPVCAEALVRQERQYACEKGHSFDIARQGYVNLLPVQQKHSLNPGDTRIQVLSRRAFLDTGVYAPIVDGLIAGAKKFCAAGPILDVGCGEGYYCTRLARALNTELLGLDISKEAVRCAAGRYKDHRFICATAAHIPVASESVGLLSSLFALTLPEEFARVLRPGGLFLEITAREDHLLGLKSIIYPELRHKEKQPKEDLPGFALLESIPIRFNFRLEGEQVQNLLYMTPHVYRISKEGLERLQQTKQLTDTASCLLRIYQKK